MIRLALRLVTLGLAFLAVQWERVEPATPKVEVRSVVVVEAPREPTAPSPAADARPRARTTPTAASSPTPAPPPASESTTDGVASAEPVELVSRAMFVVDGAIGGIDVDCGARSGSGTRSIRMTDFPAGSCRVRAHTPDGTYETRVQVDRALTVNCGLSGSDLECTRPAL